MLTGASTLDGKRPIPSELSDPAASCARVHGFVMIS